MLNTFKDLKDELKRRLSITAASTFFTDDKIAKAIRQAYGWASTLYQWPFLEKAKITETKAGYYYYDYPPKFLSDSLTRLVVDGEKYEQKNFDDFLDYKYHQKGDEKIFADYARQFFIHPEPTEDGKKIIVWGLEEPADLSADNDRTIFSYGEKAGNEAIVKKGLAILLPTANKKKEAQQEEQEAIQILANIYSKILQRKAKYQHIAKPMLDVPDFFR